MNDLATIYYYDIGDYLSREQKLGWRSISREGAKARSWNVEELSAIVVDTAFHIHKDFDLIKRIVTLSLETRRIVKTLPELVLCFLQTRITERH